MSISCWCWKTLTSWDPLSENRGGVGGGEEWQRSTSSNALRITKGKGAVKSEKQNELQEGDKLTEICKFEEGEGRVVWQRWPP